MLNVRAVELAMAIGIALHSRDRAFDVPPQELLLSRHAQGLSDQPVRPADQRRAGTSTFLDGSRVSIERAHLEEDTGKSTHLGASGRIHGAERSLVDYNRSGVPLVEIVSGPDIRSSAQARLYASELRGISDRDWRVGRAHGRRVHAHRRQRLGATRGRALRDAL